MMGQAGISGKDLDSILISHGHEDHDGALAETAELTGARVRAHMIYDRLIRYYPEKAPKDFRENLPAICWRCVMPEDYIEENCIEYQKARNRVKVEPIRDEKFQLSEAVEIYHLPGHSPDAITLVVGAEAVLVGDTVLPGITPWPTQEALFQGVKGILNPEYRRPEEIFGLRAYIRSLKRLKQITAGMGDLVVLPAHRLFYKEEWNDMILEKRIDELIRHHLDRCGAMLEIIDKEPKTPGEIALEHFDESLLKGYGSHMAEMEMNSHCEILRAAGDVEEMEGNRYLAAGSRNFESLIRSLGADFSDT
jgi:glyoxylase-like metal-dependent hydrolase (beta-lactamase superfamily II)